MTTEPSFDVEPHRQGHGALGLARRTLVVMGVVVTVLVLLMLVWYGTQFLLLIFAGVLLAILLHDLSRSLQRATGMKDGWSLAVVLLIGFAVIFIVGWFIADRVAAQFNELFERLPLAIETLYERLQRFPWLVDAIERLPSLTEMMRGRGSLVGSVTGFASTLFGVFVSFILVIILGIYFASQPGLYANGVTRLVPVRRRKRASEIMSVLSNALGRWLLGRFVLMFINGSLTALGLWLIDMPLALTLGLLAGVLNFIPNFGPIIAAIPAVLIALLQGPQPALYTAMLYVVVQMTDAYLFTPLVDRRSVELPPVLTIAAQLFLGFMAGVIGLLLASPLTAAAMILVKMLYIEDVLGDPIMRESAVGEHHGEAQQ